MPAAPREILFRMKGGAAWPSITTVGGSASNQKKRGVRWLIVFVCIASLLAVNFILYNPFLGRLDLRERLGASRRSSVLLDRNGRVVTALNPARIIWVPLEKIPVPLREMIIAVEDSRFYSHRGVDMRGILRALMENLRQGEKVQGGSTITQQLAKNLFLTQERTFRRKLAEIGYAVRIERQYSKDQILEIYLNDIYFGQGAYGIEAAARTYFGRSVQELSLDQMALLAGLPKGPEYYSPFKHPERAKARRNTVLAIMEKKGLIPAGLREELAARPLGTLAQPGVPTRGSYFADYVVAQLSQEHGWTERFIRAGGFADPYPIGPETATVCRGYCGQCAGVAGRCRTPGCRGGAGFRHRGNPGNGGGTQLSSFTVEPGHGGTQATGLGH